MTRVNLILMVALAGLTSLFIQTASGQRQPSYVDDQDDQGGYYEEENVPPPPRRSSPPKKSSNSRPAAASQSAPRAPPVGILKQINRHNEDGSYTYGYEGEDGSFKIETKLPTGEVMGKYGYVDDVGKVRVVEYGANRYGFMPSGEGITVAEPTIVEEVTDKNGNIIEEDEEELEPQQPQQRPALRPIAKAAPRPAPAPAPAPKLQASIRPAILELEESEQFEPAPARPVFQPAPQPAPKPKFSPPAIEHSFTSALPSSRSSAPSRPSVSFSNAAPAPPRPIFSNAAPIPVARQSSPPPRPSAISHSFPAATPSRNSRPSNLDSFNPGPAPVYEEPLPPSRPVPRPAPARLPVPQRSISGSSGILDQLAKDYALPEGDSRRAVDISFSTI